MVLYREYPPHAALADYLACVWTCTVMPGAEAVSHRVLPDNCMDILWQDTGSAARVAGMMSTLMVVPVLQPVRTVAVRFKPGAAASFFAPPLYELADRHPDLADFWGAGEAARFADALWERPLDDQAAVDTVQRLLLQRLPAGGAARRPGLVDAALAAIETSQGSMRVDTLASQLGVSRQHLAQQFRIRVGLGTKLFARVSRFRHAGARIRSAQTSQLDWASLATELGFHDQAHLIHEFRALGGATPASFAAG